MKQDLVTELINALTILPGVGKKSAQRMALYLLDRNKDGASILASTLKEAIDNIQRCSSCRMLTPIDGVGPDELGINDLIQIIDQDEVKEIILATSSTVEGDATAIYIKDHVKKAKVSRISYGIPIGGELEYVDGTTIARAIEGRVEINVD